MDILYNVDDHVEYIVVLSGKTVVYSGRVLGIQETGHKTDAYRIKRGRSLQDNVGMCGLEEDIVSPTCILGLVSER